MARSTRRKYYKRRSGKWSSNIQRIRLIGDAGTPGFFGDTFTIAQNPGQDNLAVSQIYTVKNIEISGQLEAQGVTSPQIGNASKIQEVTYYIMYVPEGYPIDITLPDKHPEWIMAYKFIGQAASAADSTAYQTPRIKTRLSRRLNTGDSIIFLYTAYNDNTVNLPIKFTGLVRWWTKAN